MTQTSSFYFQKAENIHNTMTVYISALIGILVGLIPVVVSFLFITQYSGTLQDINSDSFNISIEAKSELAIEQLMQLDIGVILVLLTIFSIAVSILIIPIYYYILKYREYKSKFIELHTKDIADEFIMRNNWTGIPSSLNDQIELYGYVNRVTCFPKNDILGALDSQYKDNLLHLLMLNMSKTGTDIVRCYVKSEYKLKGLLLSTLKKNILGAYITKKILKNTNHDKNEYVIFGSLLNKKKAAVIIELSRYPCKNIKEFSESIGLKESELTRIIKWFEGDGIVHSNSSGESKQYELNYMVKSELVKLSELKYISKSQRY